MRRLVPLLAFLGGIIALALLIPRYNGVQPRVEITRGEAERIANEEARKLGIPVEKAWTTTTWVGSGLLDKELQEDPERYRAAQDDPVIGPRLGGYRITYYRRGLEKFPPYGHVYISGQGETISARLRQRPETPGASMTEAQLRPLADAFIASRHIPGGPSLVFESARPIVARSRTDWTFRYKATPKMQIGNVVTYVWVYYNGDRFAGWDLIEEYADGTPFRGDPEIAGAFLGFGALYILELLLLVMFLKKYHAGEVGVGTATFLFAAVLLIAVGLDVIIAPSASDGSTLGSIDAQQNAWAVAGFKVLFVDIPLAVLVFLAWAVGESYARERWGERLASFDAILRRDPVNATVGSSLLTGILASPAIAAASLLLGLIPLLLGFAHPVMGDTAMILYLGGPLAAVLAAAGNALLAAMVAILFVLAFAHRRRMLWLGILAAVVLMAIGGVAAPPIAPLVPRLLFGWGAGIAAILVFLRWDLLTSAIALFFGTLLTSVLPLLSVADGPLAQQLSLAIAIPALLAGGIGVAGLFTGRDVVYSYEDLAPHVKRIVERERVKAEIDAANRIQAALLPLNAPAFAGASVSSHYRAATEIGGDYFDFLKLGTGQIGIAFGDVSGHGLTSGIVMAMAKSALLVQVDYDSSPRAVLNMLNEVVIKTAPKRIMMTFFFGVLDASAQVLCFSSAGHLDPYVYRAGTGKLESLSSWGFPLGVRRREPFREHNVEFSAGDRLVLYSDGLIEAIDDDGNPFGFDRFEQTIVSSGHGSADEIKKALLNAVKKFTRNRPPEDDQTLVVVAFEELAADVVPTDTRLISLDAAETVH
ncbi:MAG TPA: PP2C family protein-serine/threonine phosphatase [Thermoanaerobaculia bacterium]|nr:PP2C family protein-serine/threonine phosphatase [Thermoanaerobaculia bacterium]